MQNNNLVVSKAGSFVRVRYAGSANSVFCNSEATRQEQVEKLRSGVRMYPSPRPHEIKGR